MRDDMMSAFWEAIQRPGGAVGRGRRWYVEIHPQAFGGVAGLCCRPWVVAMREAALGSDYKIVEIGLAAPFQRAMKQTWRRDFLLLPERQPTLADAALCGGLIEPHRVRSRFYAPLPSENTLDRHPFFHHWPHHCEVAPNPQSTYFSKRNWTPCSEEGKHKSVCAG